MMFIDRSLNYGRHHTEYFLQLAQPFTTVLDIGAGYGDDLALAKQTNPHAVIHAVEVNCEYANKLAGKGVKVHSLDIEKDSFPFADGTVDIVIANQILEHVKEIFWIFHEISRILPVGGKLIIGVPNLASFHNRILLACGRQPTSLKNNSAHLRGFTKGDVLRIFNECFPGGYQLLKFSGSNFYPFPPWLAKPLALLFPTLSWSIFFLLEKRRDYHDEFLRYPMVEKLETNFFLGKS